MPDLSHLPLNNLAIDSLPLAFGIIMAIIGLVFYTQGLPGKFWRRFYAVLPGIVLCCFIPAILNSLGVEIVLGGDQCSYQQAEDYFSYRRDAKTGRMATFVFMQ